jgi:inosine/xanthosine triphosphatase
MLIVVGSINDGKIKGVHAAFEAAFPRQGPYKIIGVEVDSGVRQQPFGDEECRRGAFNRATSALQCKPCGDFGVGVESGLCVMEDGLCFDRAWVAVLHKDGRTGFSTSVSVPVPTRLLARVISEGSGLGRVTDDILGEKDTRLRGGYSGMVTNRALMRTSDVRNAVVAALAPFISPGLFAP